MPSVPQGFHSFKVLISISESHGLVVYGFEQSLSSILHPPFMVLVTQVVERELISK
jgi:hypothetical protein